MATFQLSPTTYTVNEDDGSVMVTVECIGATLTFDVEVTFETVVSGSTATGIAHVIDIGELCGIYIVFLPMNTGIMFAYCGTIS